MKIFKWSPQTRCFNLLSNSLFDTKSQHTKISWWNYIWIKGLKRLQGSQAFQFFWCVYPVEIRLNVH